MSLTKPQTGISNDTGESNFKQTHIDTHTHTHTHRETHTHTYTRTHSHTHTHTEMAQFTSQVLHPHHTHRHTHTHTHMHTLTRHPLSTPQIDCRVSTQHYKHPYVRNTKPQRSTLSTTL